MYIQYNMDQLVLPMDVEIVIPQNHLSRVIHTTVEKMDTSIFTPHYPRGGRPPYHPKLLLKVILYAYAKGIYSSRKIAELLRENIYFMWLSGHQTPDFRTINRFRSERMKEIIYTTFFAIVDMLHEAKLVRLENYFLDGTKIEANANKYTFVWRKSTERYDSGVDEKYKKIVATIERASEEDQQAEREKIQREDDTPLVSSETIIETIKELEQRLQDTPKDKILKKAKRELEKDLLPRKQKYDKQKAILQGRNSYSKTDTDAVFMRMKDDHMKNGQLKAGYNVQIGTENQFVTGFSLHQRAGDPGCLIPHFDILKKYGRVKPANLIADSGYGSEENYAFCEKEHVKAYVKYTTIDKEQTKSWTEQIGRLENMVYDEELDEWTCANDKRLQFSSENKQQTDNGYETIKRTYRCTECTGCPFQEKCAKGEKTKSIRVSMVNQGQRQEVRELLATEHGKQIYRQRKIDVEPVFGQIKHNHGFQRFSLRGLSKNTVEWGLICAAHNLRKWAIKLNQRPSKIVKQA